MSQQDVKYGILRNSGEEEFFASQSVDIYKRMYTYMESEGTMMTKYQGGIDRVRNSYGKSKCKQLLVYIKMTFGGQIKLVFNKERRL